MIKFHNGYQVELAARHQKQGPGCGNSEIEDMLSSFSAYADGVRGCARGQVRRRAWQRQREITKDHAWLALASAAGHQAGHVGKWPCSPTVWPP